MTAALVSRPQPLNRRQAAIAAAEGSGTVIRSIRVTPTGQDESVSTLVEMQTQASMPPAWIEEVVQQQIPAKDEHGLIRLETLIRFARACSVLPSTTPRPFIDVGDDSTIGAECDLGPFHLEIQVGNNPDVDSIVFEVDEGDISEIPLQGNLRPLSALMTQIVKHR
jgi:hypothetical protein